MTGRGQQGGSPGRDHWRGGRDDSASNPRRAHEAPARSDAESFGTRVEVEELSTHALASRPRARLPVTGLLAAAAIAVLLAAGSGLLGGGSTGGGSVASPIRSGATDMPSALPPDTAPPVPLVTPWSECSPAPASPPQPVLEIEGRQYFGEVEILDRNIDPTVDDVTGWPVRVADDAILVPMDAIAELWIVGGSCAVAWNIGLADQGSLEPQILESVPNQDRNSAVAAQNRFQVFVAPLVGDLFLRAVFVFDDVAMAATWPIHVPALEPPRIVLTTGANEIQTAAGCDVTQRLANGWEERVNDCLRDVARDPGPRADVRAGEPLQFAIVDWATRSTTIVCGQLTERTFVPLTGSPCIRERDPLYAGVRFSAPETPGPMTLAIATCASRIRVVGTGFEELCGTWYANIRIRG